MSAKRNNPGMFVSAWEADEQDIDSWTNLQIKSNAVFWVFLDDPKKQFIVAAEEGNLENVKKIIKNCENGDNLENIKELLSTKDQDGYTALHRAAYGGHTNVLEVCIIYEFTKFM